MESQMTLHIRDNTEIPEDTAKLVKEILDEDDPYRLIGDRLSDFLVDEDFADFYADTGGPAISPVILSFVLIFQMMEKLPDRMAARALKVRMDWKYALHLPLNYEGFHFTNLSHFRQRLIENEAKYLVFDKLLQTLIDLGLVRQKGKVRTDSSHVLGAIANLSRLELVLETERVVLNVLQKEDQEWYNEQIPAAFQEEYGTKRSDYQLSENEVKRTLQQAGADGWWLLQRLKQAPKTLQALEKVQTMQEIWEQQFETDENEQYVGPRKKLESSGLIQSPHDPEAHYKVKRTTKWRGYKIQVTETAEDKGDPNFILDIKATDAQLADYSVLLEIQNRLLRRGIFPKKQYVDYAYISTYLLKKSADQGIVLMGPARQEPITGLFKIVDFEFDLDKRIATCPAGKESTRCTLTKSPYGGQNFMFRFGRQCQNCSLKKQCTISKIGRSIRYHIYREFLENRLAEMETEEFWKDMKHRPPVEGTISQLTRHGARQARYIGTDKVDLQEILTGVAVNMKRLLRVWSTGTKPSWA